MKKQADNKRTGNNQEYNSSTDEICLSLFLTSIQTSNLASLPYPSLVNLFEHYLKTKLYVSGFDIVIVDEKDYWNDLS